MFPNHQRRNKHFPAFIKRKILRTTENSRIGTGKIFRGAFHQSGAVEGFWRIVRSTNHSHGELRGLAERTCVPEEKNFLPWE